MAERLRGEAKGIYLTQSANLNGISILSEVVWSVLLESVLVDVSIL